MIQQPASSVNQPTSRWTAGHTAVLNKKRRALEAKRILSPAGFCTARVWGRRNSTQGRAQGRRRAREESGERPRKRGLSRGLCWPRIPRGHRSSWRAGGGRCVESAGSQIWKEGPRRAGSVLRDWWINRGGKAWWEQPCNPLEGTQKRSHSATASETAGMTAPPGGGGKQPLCRGAPDLCPENRGQPRGPPCLQRTGGAVLIAGTPRCST